MLPIFTLAVSSRYKVLIISRICPSIPLSCNFLISRSLGTQSKALLKSTKHPYNLFPDLWQYLRIRLWSIMWGSEVLLP